MYIRTQSLPSYDVSELARMPNAQTSVSCYPPCIKSSILSLPILRNSWTRQNSQALRHSVLQATSCDTFSCENIPNETKQFILLT